jgi:glycosyl transferase family 25
MNRVDRVYYINLDHRTDRLEHIKSELAKTTVDPSNVHRFPAVYVPEFGALGCTLSHIQVLEDFLRSDANSCIIFEDDFEFIQSQDVVNNLLDKVFDELPEFDVVMLSCATIKETPIPSYTFVTKTIEAFTTSGYMVSKYFAPTLLENFKEGCLLLEEAGNRHNHFCVDRYWNRLQPITEWYTLSPRVGKQMDSYSDIEERIMIQTA